MFVVKVESLKVKVKVNTALDTRFISDVGGDEDRQCDIDVT